MRIPPERAFRQSFSTLFASGTTAARMSVMLNLSTQLQLIILPDFTGFEHWIAVDDVALRTIDLVSDTELECHVGRHAREPKPPCLVRLLNRDWLANV